jgi:Capsule polysaccharide biosynthesis protein
MSSIFEKLVYRLEVSRQRRRINRDIFHITEEVHARSPRYTDPLAAEVQKPVALFNASTRLTGMSLNAAFSLLASLGLQMAGVSVVRFACHAGMSLCVLGTDRHDPARLPPCKPCIAQSQALFSDATNTPFTYQPDRSLEEKLNHLSVERLCDFSALPPAWVGQSASAPGIPLGQLVLPSVRWILRRHHLLDDAPTRLILRQYILSAHHVAQAFSAFLDKTHPQAVVLFNGQFFPEATARWVSLQRGIRTITHEVGLLPFSAFFTTGEATAYPLNVPDDFELNQAQDKRLDDYLSQRFQGQFSMAGIRFWPEMKDLEDEFLQRLASFKQIVPVFTNVIFDTSQPHSNLIFPHMFAWLDLVLEITHSHPETLFVLRAHPDEARPGKASHESVSQWVTENKANALPNLIFVDSNQVLSSYELIQRSKLVMVYNSTIGLEASILGKPVLSAGRARYTQLPTVFFPASQGEYRQQLEDFLQAESISVPPEFKNNARRFLYYQLYRSSLPFGDYLEDDGIWPGFVKLKKFDAQALAPSVSPAINAIHKGILREGDFLLESEPLPPGHR